MTVILQILENLVLLVFLGLGYYYIEKAKPVLQPSIYMISHGMSFGLIAFLVTSAPVSLGDGATVDARAGPVMLAGVVAGPVAASIAAVLGGLARGLVGGSFAFSGVLVYGVYAAIGTGFWFFFKNRNLDFLKRRNVMLLAAASCIGASGMFLIIDPLDRALAWLRNDLPLIFVANTLSTVFTALVLSVAQDILGKSRAALEVHETLRLAKKAGGFGIWDFDMKSGKMTWDERSSELHEFPTDGFAGGVDDWARNVHPDDLKHSVDDFNWSAKNSDTFATEYRVLQKDNVARVIKVDGVVLRNESGDAVRAVGTNLDLTRIRATEEQLQEAQLVAVHAQKFDTIGQLTGGVAHDFNNLLAVIMGNLELIADETSKDNFDKEEIKILLEASLEATRRGADLTQNMLAYARKAQLSPVVLDINSVVRETESWMRRTIPSSIEIETNLETDPWMALVDKSSLQSALVNLLLNARDAFSGSGQVTIETRNLILKASDLADSQLELPPDKYVTLLVSDNGTGIDPAVLKSIFDPFFTTKRVGEGSGLGLSMVQGFVEQSGGAIRVHSELGLGTQFTMYFPATVQDLEDSTPPLGEILKNPNPSEPSKRILLVEDRYEVLRVLEKTLFNSGYEVTTATSGDEGFAVFCIDRGFDLVVTDIVMPGELQGPSMVGELRKLQPDIKVIFLSGYSSEGQVDEASLNDSDIRLMKPVSRDTLLSTVSKCFQCDSDTEKSDV